MGRRHHVVMANSPVLTSILRTLVPWLVALLGPAALNWLGLTEATLSGVLTVGIGAIYYLIVRLLEQVHPKFGVLLGVPAEPTYGDARGAVDEPPRH